MSNIIKINEIETSPEKKYIDVAWGCKQQLPNVYDSFRKTFLRGQ